MATAPTAPHDYRLRSPENFGDTPNGQAAINALTAMLQKLTDPDTDQPYLDAGASDTDTIRAMESFFSNQTDKQKKPYYTYVDNATTVNEMGSHLRAAIQGWMADNGVPDADSTGAFPNIVGRVGDAVSVFMAKQDVAGSNNPSSQPAAASPEEASGTPADASPALPKKAHHGFLHGLKTIFATDVWHGIKAVGRGAKDVGKALVEDQTVVIGAPDAVAYAPPPAPPAPSDADMNYNGSGRYYAGMRPKVIAMPRAKPSDDPLRYTAWNDFSPSQKAEYQQYFDAGKKVGQQESALHEGAPDGNKTMDFYGHTLPDAQNAATQDGGSVAYHVFELGRSAGFDKKANAQINEQTQTFQTQQNQGFRSNFSWNRFFSLTPEG